MLPDPGPVPGLRYLGFDGYQTLLPRTRVSAPAVIIAIDDRSLARVGQWPWPRDTMARLVDRIAARNPAVIAIDVVFAEPDRTSPERLAVQFGERDPELAARLRTLPSHDATFAETLAKTPVVLGVIGSDDAGDTGNGFAPARMVGPPPALLAYRSGSRSRPDIDAAASGRGLFDANLDDGVVRRVPLVAMVGGYPLLSLPMESLRVAAGEAFFSLDTTSSGPLRVVIGDLVVPAQADGSLWLNYAGHSADRYVSAVDVLEGRDDPTSIAGSVALIGVTGLGLVDQQLTPNGESLPGVEVHAEVIENVFDGALLYRPELARLYETLAFAVLALVALVWVPRVSPARSTVIFVVSASLLVGSGLASYAWQRQLFDPLTPLLGLAALHAVLVLATMVTLDLERRALAASLIVEREATARTAGELEAARRIQTGMLPRPEIVLSDESRVEVFAHMRPAREVGGDLYDFFYLEGHRLFVVVGDVAGKGVAAALFMAVSKALTKSSSLRGRMGLDRLMAVVNRELSRDNPDSLFVTLLAMVLDLDSGRLEYCNAGHEPLLVVRGDASVHAVDEGGGPPLCVVEGAVYASAEVLLQPGESLALVSDGITEAMSADGTLFGREALKALLQALPMRDGNLADNGQQILQTVTAYEAGADPVDDQTLLLLRWRGRAPLRT